MFNETFDSITEENRTLTVAFSSNFCSFSNKDTIDALYVIMSDPDEKLFLKYLVYYSLNVGEKLSINNEMQVFIIYMK